MTLLIFLLLASAYLLFANYKNYWGILFGVILALTVAFIIIDTFSIPVFKEKFFSAMRRRNKKETLSEDTSSLVLKRANYKCQSCGAPGRRIYHMDREKSHNDPNNLVCLCDKCLKKVEDGSISSHQLYFMRLGERNAKKKRV